MDISAIQQLFYAAIPNAIENKIPLLYQQASLYSANLLNKHSLYMYYYVK